MMARVVAQAKIPVAKTIRPTINSVCFQAKLSRPNLFE